MTPLNPDWQKLKAEPFGAHIPDEILQYRSDEIQRILDWKAQNPIALPAEIEIGSNRGCFLLGLARGRRDTSFLGIELKESLCRISANKLAREGLTNGHVIHADARLALPVLFEPGSVDAIYVLFPDPWWKKRHARRRLLDDSFFEMAHVFLKPGGHFVLKTDVLDYFDAVEEFLKASPCFEFVDIKDVPGNETWTLSTRERHCLEDGLPYKQLAIRNLETSPSELPKTTLTEKKLQKHNYRYHPEEK
ncbi:MAG: hypothetical protein II767_02270 [Proteobacteria bacterium]|nr:hypothetical protein [Pseudomonadota bacterium]MBQ4359061.1 hypothetical protein [Pseudomonadota bacterium]